MSDFNENVFSMKEPGVVAAVLNEELVLNTSVRVGEGTVLWLEDGANASVRCDNIEPHKEVVVCQSNDALCGGTGLLKAGIEQLCILAVWLVEHEVRPEVVKTVRVENRGSLL